MLAAIAIILVVLWLLGFVVLHVAGWAIHLLLILAVVAIVLRFARGRSA